MIMSIQLQKFWAGFFGKVEKPVPNQNGHINIDSWAYNYNIIETIGLVDFLIEKIPNFIMKWAFW